MRRQQDLCCYGLSATFALQQHRRVLHDDDGDDDDHDVMEFPFTSFVTNPLRDVRRSWARQVEWKMER
jgi:hypothetical protein